MNINSIRRHRSKDTLVVFLTLATVVVTVTSLQNRPSVQADIAPLSVSLPPMNLTLAAVNGTQLVLNSTDIGSLPSYRAFGGYKNQLGNIRGLGNYTGVPITALCDLVGGINSNDILRVSASDAYNITFTYDQVKNGDFVAYDPATGDQVSHLQPLIPVIAYYKNDATLSSNEGPLRLAIVGSEGFVTNSTYWVKWVVKLEMIRVGIPEFPSQLIVILFMVITLFVAIAYRKSQSLKSIAARINRKHHRFAYNQRDLQLGFASYSLPKCF